MNGLALDLTGRLTLTVQECADILELGRDNTYDAINAGAIPAIRLGGRRILVPTHRLLEEVLGIDAATVAQILGLPHERSDAGCCEHPASAMSTPDPSQFEGDHHHGASVTPVGSITERRRSA